MGIRVNKPDYSEAAALEVLMRTLHQTLTENNDNYEATNDDKHLDDHFSIVIGGKSIEFILGGPQSQALHNFIEHIADENGYSVDIAQETVSE